MENSKVNTQTTEKPKMTKQDKIKMIVGIAICVILGFVLVCNLTIIIKGSVNPDTPPSVFGVTPLVVLSGSMSGDADGHIEVGDLVFIVKEDYSDLEVDDVVTYRQGKSFTTHRIIGKDDDGNFITKGDANNTSDKQPLTEDVYIGKVVGRIPKVGDFALFLQTTLGTVLFVGLPLLAFVLYDVIRRQRFAKKEGSKTAELEAELARLRALAGENSASPAPNESADSAEPSAAENNSSDGKTDGE